MPLFSPIILTGSYLLHLIATVVWIGGLVVIALVIQPIASKTITDAAALAKLLDSIHTRFQPLANISLIVLIFTGLIQLVANKYYKGFLAIDNTWSQAILLKHISVGLMIVFALIMNFGIEPAMRRNAFLAANDLIDDKAVAKLRLQQTRLTRLNLVFSILVLIFTAIARAQ
jgi:uncharacterized membrane protein